MCAQSAPQIQCRKYHPNENWSEHRRGNVIVMPDLPEPLVGSVCREYLVLVIVVGETHLRRTLKLYGLSHNTSLIFAPASCSRSTPIICSSLKPSPSSSVFFLATNTTPFRLSVRRADHEIHGQGLKLPGFDRPIPRLNVTAVRGLDKNGIGFLPMRSGFEIKQQKAPVGWLTRGERGACVVTNSSRCRRFSRKATKATCTHPAQASDRPIRSSISPPIAFDGNLEIRVIPRRGDENCLTYDHRKV